MPATSISKEEFVHNLRQSGLVSAAQIAPALARVAAGTSGRGTARAFVAAGLLTKFQAELLLAGRTTGFFLGQYTILDQLGQGGMGRVYKAVHKTLDRVVALKMLAPQLVRTPRARALFKRELRAAGQLNHPNIVTAYDANKIDGRHFLVLEYVDGPNLDQLVREHGPLPVGLACEIIRQAALGLECAYGLGMVHRDIKPANLLIERVGKTVAPLVKILDFGLARLHEPPGQEDAGATIVTKENTVMGTPDYLSPEQARNLNRVDIRADLYSLGCTFYFLLTGRVPYPGGSALQKLLRHSTEEPAPIEQDVPAAVLAILRRLMAKKPEERFQTPAEVAAAVAPYAVPAVPFWSLESDAAHGSDPDLKALDGSDGAMALVGTLPPDFSPTPLSGDGVPAPSDALSARLWLALAISTGIVGGLIGLLTLLLNH
jgi:eukaryotic-like serine/threonine-protein kinase